MDDFAYLSPDAAYFDAACQSLRPAPVIQALNDYYQNFNSCGERVKYAWGKQTDEKVAATRAKVLQYLKLSPREYFTSFTLNTTYGLNLILSQIAPNQFVKIITSNLEHNSPFLATIAAAKRLGIPREVIDREPDGSINSSHDFTKSIVVFGAVSNIDGRELKNLKEIVKKIHQQGGIIILDAAQALAHNAELLAKTEADAICASAHKMYAPSLGIIVAHKDLLPKLEVNFLGGGMVDDVEKSTFQLSAENPAHIYTRFEAGLQAWGEIIALGAAIDWRMQQNTKNLMAYSKSNFEFLRGQNRIKLLNREFSPTLSFCVEGLDSHLLGAALSHENIMVRTGYFCAHYYLSHQNNYPPLVRVSLGLHNRESDIAKFQDAMRKVLEA
ncbi:MAG: aminotransferase class V-fold PLP-dependent enzyme [Candidatus Nomurabacteria bacterium]|jgi:cysteine desulfurase/selenocysteine lyase|nr:aminotransferase class V-fold PLP-dependent enzyme [Candidatus Nomurabacteria bacterium]